MERPPSLQKRCAFQEQKLETVASTLAFAAGKALPQWPLTVSIELGDDCLQRCVMCEPFSQLNPHRRQTPSTSRLDEHPELLWSDSVAPLLRHALLIRLSGRGEPLILPHLEETLRHLATFEAPIELITNGMGLTPERCDLLVELGIESVGVSFSGATKDAYERVYRGGNFAQLLAGISNLHAAKQRRQSAYPLITAKTLAFEHHVESLVAFVHLVGPLGMNSVEVAPLQTTGEIPALAGHAALFRTSHEGAIIESAREAAKAYDLSLDTSAFERACACDDSHWERRKHTQFYKCGFPHLQEYTTVPLGHLPKSVPLTTAPPLETVRPRFVSVSSPLLPHYLELRIPDFLTEPFFCFEPFTQIVIRSDGTTQTCALAAPDAPALGTIEQSDGAELWNAERPSTVREGICGGGYPLRACEACLRHQRGPRHHAMTEMLERYRHWSEAQFGTCAAVRAEDFREIPSENAVIVDRLRQHDAARFGTPLTIPNQVAVGAPSTADPRLPLLQQELELRQQRHGDVHEVFCGDLGESTPGVLAGWVWSPLLPEMRLTVDILINGRVIALVVADSYRSDLRAAGVGDGMHSFSLAIPRKELQHGEILAQARVTGTSALLRPQAVPLSGLTS